MYARIMPQLKGNNQAEGLWALVAVDEEDFEGSSTTLWQADSHEELADLAKDHFVGKEGTENFKPELDKKFKREWGIMFLPTHIGYVKTKADLKDIVKGKKK